MAQQVKHDSDIQEFKNPELIELPIQFSDANRLLICAGTAICDFKATGDSPDDVDLRFFLRDDNGNIIPFSPRGDHIFRAVTHVALNGFHNDGGEQFHFSVDEADTDLVHDKAEVHVKLRVAGGDTARDGHILALGYHVTLLARMVEPLPPLFERPS
jgi:hypothetical protein